MAVQVNTSKVLKQQKSLLIQDDKSAVKNIKEEVKVIEKNKKKNTEKKQKVNDFNIDSYEIYLNSVLSNLNNVEERNLKWTEIIEKTCHIAHNILSSLKDNKKQLEVQNDPHKASAILQDMQTQIKILNSMQKTIKQQVEFQKMEKEAKNNE